MRVFEVELIIRIYYIERLVYTRRDNGFTIGDGYNSI